LSPTTAAPPTLLLVAAELEADILFGPRDARPPWLNIHVAGVGVPADESAAEAIARTDAGLIVNPGFAGGLTADAEPGAAFVVTSWSGRQVEAMPEAAAAAATLAAMVDARPAVAVTVDKPAGDPTARQRLAATGAALVEMEGARWAALASNAGLPFLSLRVISDRADNRLPRPRHELFRKNGSVRWRRWFAAVDRRPARLLDSYRKLGVARRDWAVATESLRAMGAGISEWQRNG